MRRANVPCFGPNFIKYPPCSARRAKSILTDTREYITVLEGRVTDSFAHDDTLISVPKRPSS